MKSTKGPDRMYGTLRVCAVLFRDIANFPSYIWEAFFWGGGGWVIITGTVRVPLLLSDGIGIH